MITLARIHNKTYDEFQNYSEIVIYSLYILSVIIAYIFLWPLITFAIGTLNGVVLTIVIFWILWMIVKIAMRFDRIEKLKVELGT
jgi:O-antigen ligase